MVDKDFIIEYIKWDSEEDKMKTICGIDCSGCTFKENCKGCKETKALMSIWNTLFQMERNSNCLTMKKYILDIK